jgi:hypothetical protein
MRGYIDFGSNINPIIINITCQFPSLSREVGGVNSSSPKNMGKGNNATGRKLRAGKGPFFVVRRRCSNLVLQEKEEKEAIREIYTFSSSSRPLPPV